MSDTTINEATGEIIASAPVRMSPSISKLTTALAKAQNEMHGAAKESVNPHFRSRYADLASVWDACREPLTKHELAVLQPARCDGRIVTVTTVLTHSSGEWIAEELSMEPTQNTPQAIGSAITYARRYGLSAMVGVAPEDDDGNEASAKPEARETKQSARETPVNGSGDDGKGKLMESYAKTVGELVATMGFAPEEFDRAKFMKIDHNKASDVLREMQLKDKVFWKMHACLRRYEFESDVADEVVTARLHDILADKAALDHKSKPLRASSQEWNTWLSEMQQKAEVPA